MEISLGTIATTAILQVGVQMIPHVLIIDFLGWCAHNNNLAFGVALHPIRTCMCFGWCIRATLAGEGTL